MTFKIPSIQYRSKSFKQQYFLDQIIRLNFIFVSTFQMPPQMGRRTDVCAGGSGVVSQPYSAAADQTQTSWLANNPYLQGSKSFANKMGFSVVLIAVTIAESFFVAFVF